MQDPPPMDRRRRFAGCEVQPHTHAWTNPRLPALSAGESPEGTPWQVNLWLIRFKVNKQLFRGELSKGAHPCSKHWARSFWQTPRGSPEVFQPSRQTPRAPNPEEKRRRLGEIPRGCETPVVPWSLPLQAAAACGFALNPC
jgi:hypothetical protein